jgi:tetratricopeptide (TPR) repeat protein
VFAGGSSFWDGGYSCPPHFYWGSSFSFGFHFGFGFHSAWLAWNYPGYYYYPQYFGFHHHGFSHAFLAGHAWHIMPFWDGWCGYNWGGHCSYWPFHHFRHRHCFQYHGFYFNVCRPYWYGHARWYDYSLYDYSYTTLAYDSLYDEGYDDGYGRGYEDGAEDASAYSDDRRRDKIGENYGRPRPDSDIDRAKTGAPEEFRYEMTRGSEAFGNGDYKTATKAFKEAVILSPDSADARYSLAISAFAEGKYSFSAFALRRGVALDAAGSKIDLQATFGDPVVFKGYVDSLNAELAENPEDADLLLLSGFIALRTGNASEAADKLDRAVKAAPQDTAAQALQREAMEALEQY